MDSKAEALSPAKKLVAMAAPLDALYNAADASVVERLEKGSFKLKNATKARVMQICAEQGTDLSEFLRECCEGLVAKYDGTQG